MGTKYIPRDGFTLVKSGQYHEACSRLRRFCDEHSITITSYRDWFEDHDSVGYPVGDDCHEVTDAAKEKILMLLSDHWRTWLRIKFIKDGYFHERNAERITP